MGGSVCQSGDCNAGLGLAQPSPAIYTDLGHPQERGASGEGLGDSPQTELGSCQALSVISNQVPCPPPLGCLPPSRGLWSRVVGTGGRRFSVRISGISCGHTCPLINIDAGYCALGTLGVNLPMPLRVGDLLPEEQGMEGRNVAEKWGHGSHRTERQEGFRRRRGSR